MMTQPVRLTKESMKTWGDTREILLLFREVYDLMDEVLAAKMSTGSLFKKVKSNYFHTVKEKIRLYLTSFQYSAAIGAFYRKQFNPDLVELTHDDFAINIRPILEKFDHKLTLDRYFSMGMKAQNAHVAFLRDILLPDFLIENGEKYLPSIKKLTTALLSLLDLFNTPYAVLQMRPIIK